MSLRMNYPHSWSIPPRWPWEAKGEISVCAVDPHAASKREGIIQYLRAILTEFGLPLQVRTVEERLCGLIGNLLGDSNGGNEIVCEEFLKKLNVARQREPLLQPALVVALNGDPKCLRDQSDSNPDEPLVWGWTSIDGLILLRLVPDQPLENVVRHEMGHLLGDDIRHRSGHDGDCVMEWSCEKKEFCAACIQNIRNTCKILE